jgi:hypothetical protein
MFWIQAAQILKITRNQKDRIIQIAGAGAASK